MATPDLKEVWDQLIETVNDIDVKLDSLTDSETAGKRKVTNELVESSKTHWENIVAQIVANVEPMDDPKTKYGIYFGLVKGLRAAFDDEASKLVTSIVETQPKSEPLISEEEAKSLGATRTEVMTKLRATKDLLVTFGADENELELPKSRRGSRGKRGKRALSYYDWFIDGVAVTGDDNTPAGVAKLLGFEKAKDFTAAMKEVQVGEGKLDTAKPPMEFSLEVRGKTVRAVRGADAPEVTEDEEEESEEEETSEEE